MSCAIKSHKRDYEEDHGEHVPDWNTVALVDGVIDAWGGVCFDVWCSECGQSGSFMLNITEDNDQVVWV